jgi:5'-3' exoribonuclease 2
MGVPSYFKTIIQSYNDILIHQTNFDSNVNNLFFDLKCLIHPRCRNLTIENEMLQKIGEYILQIIDIVKPKDLIYLAIDGVCPRAKIEQQRKRRFKSALEKKIWDTNAITPGTKFMSNLNKFLKKKFKNHKNIKISDSTIKGEGEHKIMEILKNQNNNDINIVYGLDADLIHLSLIRENNIYLLRETTEYNFEQVDCEFIYLDINILKKYLVKDIKRDYKISNQTTINDYVFLCFFIGNDFIHNSPMINIRYGGLDYLLEVYNSCQTYHSGYFYLIYENKLDLKNFKYFINKLCSKEKEKLENILNIRKNQEKKYLNIYENIYHSYKKKDLNDFTDEYITEFKNHLPVIDREDEKWVFKDFKNHNRRYYFYNKFLNKNYDPSFDDVILFEKKNICENYLESIVWTTNYYFDSNLSWKWYYRYHYSPLLEDLNDYLKNIDSLDVIKSDPESLEPKQQLLLVLPENSLYLNDNLKNEDYYYPKSFHTNTFMKRYSWEGYPVLPG